MSKKGYIYALIMVVCSLLTACTGEQSQLQGGQVLLGITADISPRMTRSGGLTNQPDMAVAFGNAETIGVTALNTDNTVYETGGTLHSNKPFTSHGTGDVQKWRVPDDQGIPLPEDGTSLKVFAYYPYNSDYDPAAIPVTCTNDADQSPSPDWMYGEGANVVNTTKPYTSIAMHHAQTAIRISLSREDANGKPAYTGPGKVERTTLTSSGFRTSGTMNTLVYPATLDFGTADANTFTVDYNGKEPVIAAVGEATDLYYYVLTTGTEGSIVIHMTIDGAEFELSTAALTLQGGHVYHFQLVITDRLLIIQSVTIAAWGDPVNISDVSQLSLENTGFSSSIPGIDMGVVDAKGNKVLFAPYNLGTTEPTELGNLYQWGCQTPVADATFDEALGHWESYRDNYPSFLNELPVDISGNPQYDAIVGQTEDNEDWMSWRIPTYDEYRQLADKNKYDVIDLTNGGGHTDYPQYGNAKGYVIVRKADRTKQLFIPQVSDFTLLWTSTPVDDSAANAAHCWLIHEGEIIKDAPGNILGRYTPLPIRPVRTVE